MSVTDDTSYRLEDVRRDKGKIVVTFSWLDAQGDRLDWGQILRLRDGKIVYMEDCGRGSAGRQVAKLFERGPN